MRRRCLTGAAICAVGGLTFTGCSKDDDPETAPTLPPIATTTPATTQVLVATTLPEYYEVQGGDTLTEIAAAYAIPVQALLTANPEVSSPDDIRAGQFLVIPSRDGLVAAQLPATAPGQTPPPMPSVPVGPSTSVP